jgi:hypothetical protein
VVYWLKLRYVVGSWMVGGVTRLRSGTVYCGLIRIINFFFLVVFFYSHILFVKVMNVIIFQCVLMLTFLCGV